MQPGIDELWHSLVGKPYAEGGRGPTHFDCYGIVLEYYRRAGIMLPDYHSLGSNQEKNLEVLSAMDNGWYEVFEPRAGDVILFEVQSAPHVGIFLKRDLFLHAVLGHSSSAEKLSHPIWEKRLKGYYRYAQI